MKIWNLTFNKMKMLQHILSISLLPLMLLTLQRCEENTPKPVLTELEKLPAATQTGKGTFGCLVDGKAWVTKLVGDSQSDYQTGTLSVFASVHNDIFNSVLDFTVTDLNLSLKTYLLTEKLSNSVSQYARYYDNTTSCGYITTSEYTGSVTVTHLDKLNYTISGTFEFEAYSTDCSLVVKITDGRFDIHYAP
jgi:hypothetical protein